MKAWKKGAIVGLIWGTLSGGIVIFGDILNFDIYAPTAFLGPIWWLLLLPIRLMGPFSAPVNGAVIGVIIGYLYEFKKRRTKELQEGKAEKIWYGVYVLATIGILHVLLTFANIATWYLIGMVVSFILGFSVAFIVTYFKTRSFEKSIAMAVLIGSISYFLASLDKTPLPYC